MTRNPAAFSLLELLVVIAILLLLLALAVPSLSSARQRAKRVACLSNQRQIALAMHAYTGEYADRFPSAQYFDAAHSAFVAWDTITPVGAPSKAKPGLIWRYTTGEGVQQCPSYDGPSMTSGDPYTGYNYNTTYIGRGENEGSHRGLGAAPATLSEVRFAVTAALVGDGGWAAGANKFMRAPLDEGVAEGTAHAGAQAYRHVKSTNVVFVDGHGQVLNQQFRKPGASAESERGLGWPANGFLAVDDRPYAHR